MLAIAWLVLAHLVADFILQNDWIAMNKGRGGRTGWAALLAHGGHVGLCLLPAAFVFGLPGLAYVGVIVVTHMAVDRWKVLATRRAEMTAQDEARQWIAAGGSDPGPGLGAAWTPVPGVLFLADQVLHLTFAIVGWLVILDGAAVISPFVDFANAVLRDWDRASVNAAILTGVVLISLFIANTRGAFFFVLALVSPRHLGPASVEPGRVAAEHTSPAAAIAGVAAGPQEGAVPETLAPGVTGGPGLRITTTILALERLVVVTLILAGAPLVVGLIIVADTIARTRQLADRGAIEYHLLSSLASLSVAIGTGLVAQAALRTLGPG